MIGMGRNLVLAWLLGAALLGLGSVDAMAQFSAWVPPALQDMERLQTELRTAEAQLKTAELRVSTLEMQRNAGLADDSRVQEAAIELQKWRGVAEDIATRVKRSQLYRALGRPVDVRFRDATVGDAAQVLSQTSGLAISVDPALQPAGRVTITANQIPVAEVLRLLAQNTKAQVTPKPGSAGILLRPVPTLEVDGQVREFPGSNAPWSPEWFEIGGPPQQVEGGAGFGFPGGGAFGGGGGFAGGGPGGGGIGGGRDPRAGNGGPGGFPMPGGPGGQIGFAPGGMPAQDATLAITAVGANRFIVATHVGRRGGMDAGRGMPLVLLSLYEIKDGKMQLLSSRLHDPGPVPGLPMPGAMPFGTGPMPGAPGGGGWPGAVPGAPGNGARPGVPGGPVPPRGRPGAIPAPPREPRPEGAEVRPPAPVKPGMAAAVP